MAMQTLSFIGCGKVGKALGKRWAQANVFSVGQILTRSAESAAAAAAFIGAGNPITEISAFEPADAFFFAAPDDVLAKLAQQLAETDMIVKGALCWHASGAITSSALQPLQNQGAEIASVHPVKSFADPTLSAESFPGTPCVIEGTAEACELLSEAMRGIGGVPITLKMTSRAKAVYHAGTTLASNGLVALAEVGLRCLEQAGLTREQGLKLLQPLMAGTVENVLQLGTAGALTGPISRGEVGTIARHLAALEGTKPEVMKAYRLLGQLTIDVARQQPNANTEVLETIQNLLHIAG
jgi:predicted short-subunit dehydrogenase-like oxidoreductase (DUF2520 family)